MIACAKSCVVDLAWSKFDVNFDSILSLFFLSGTQFRPVSSERTIERLSNRSSWSRAHLKRARSSQEEGQSLR